MPSRQKPAKPPRRRRSYASRIAAYEAAKAGWDAANPGADYRTRDLAMRQLALRLGV